MYYTQKGPYTNDEKTAVEVAMLRSFDNGLTWEPKVTGAPWSGIRLSQNDRQKPTSAARAEDGMPVAVELQGGKGIVYVCETEHGEVTGPWVVWSDRERNWNYPDFKSTDFGPWDRRWLVHEDFKGFAPYMLQMKSGEVLVASNGSFKGGETGFYVFIGDGSAKNFAEPTEPFHGVGGWWGSIEALDDHTIVASANNTVGPDIKNDFDSRKRLLKTEGEMIRDFDVLRGMVNVGTDISEPVWNTKNRLFMGSKSQAQATVKLAYDNDNLYVCVEANDDKLQNNGDKFTENDGVSVYLDVNNGKATALSNAIYRLNVTGQDVYLEQYSGNSWQRVDGVQGKVNVIGTVNDNSDKDTGYYTKAAIPWQTVGGTKDKIGIASELFNNDYGKNSVIVNTVAGVSINAPSTWFTASLTDNESTGEAYLAEYPQTQRSSLQDINGHWAQQEIKEMNMEGLVNGETESTFNPESSITRAEFIAIAVRALGYTEQWYDSVFSDVKDTEWYAGILQRAADLSILDENLIVNNNILPNSPITREEIAAILAKSYLPYAKSSAYTKEITFTDKVQISSWAEEYVKNAVNYGFIKGTPDNTFAPNDTATRAEAAVMLHRFYTAIKNPDLSNESMAIEAVEMGLGIVGKKSVYALDFGTKSSAVVPGFTKVTEKTLYTEGGFGWIGTTSLKPRDRVSVNSNLNSDFVLGGDVAGSTNKFKLDVENGKYKVDLVMGDGDYVKELVELKINGASVAKDVKVDINKFKLMTFDVEVTNGAVEIEFIGTGVTNVHWSINSLAVTSID